MKICYNVGCVNRANTKICCNAGSVIGASMKICYNVGSVNEASMKIFYNVGSVNEANTKVCCNVGSVNEANTKVCCNVGSVNRANTKICYNVGSVYRANTKICYNVGSVNGTNTKICCNEGSVYGADTFFSTIYSITNFKKNKMDLIPWKFTEDQFEIETRGSVKKAVILSIAHDNNLRILSFQYPLLSPLYTRYHPLHLLFMSGYDSLSSSGSLKHGERESVSQSLVAAKLLLTEEWMPAILLIYKKKSPRFKAIFPNGLKSFNKGGIDKKIKAFDLLSLNIGTDPALATIKGVIDTTYTALHLARTNQNAAKIYTSGNSVLLETLRFNAMKMQYRNLGYIMDNFCDTVAIMCALVFDLVTLRESPQVIFKGTILRMASRNILSHTFLADDQFAVKIIGTGSYRFWLSPTANSNENTEVEILANIKTVIKLSQFEVTDYANNRFLNLESTSTEAGNFRLQLL